jgi:hypothetical protein
MHSGFFVWLNQQPTGTASFMGTLAGSTLGFCALSAGALFNAHLNRRRDDRQRRQDRTALATALSAELQLIREILLDNCDTLRDPNQGDGFFVPSPAVQIMPKLIDRMGLLSAETIKAVTSAYLVIGQYRRELLTLGAAKLQNPDNDQLWLPVGHASNVIRMNTVKADFISVALKALEPYLDERGRGRIAPP